MGEYDARFLILAGEFSVNVKLGTGGVTVDVGAMMGTCVGVVTLAAGVSAWMEGIPRRRALGTRGDVRAGERTFLSSTFEERACTWNDVAHHDMPGHGKTAHHPSQALNTHCRGMPCSPYLPPPASYIQAVSPIASHHMRVAYIHPICPTGYDSHDDIWSWSRAARRGEKTDAYMSKHTVTYDIPPHV